MAGAWHSRAGRALVAALAVLLLLAASAAAAPTARSGGDGNVAQTPGTQTTTTPATTPTTPAGTSTTPTGTTQSSSNRDPGVAKWILLFGALVLGMTLLYLNGWRESWEGVTKLVFRRVGVLPETTFVSAVADELLEEAAPVLEITGPLVLPVGRTETYRATLDGSPAESAAWVVAPPDRAAPAPPSGAEIKVTAITAGPFTLTATANGATTDAHVAAIEPASSPGSLPLVGAGYGGVIVAIVAVTIAATITALGLLDGAALATLLGTVVAYFFVQAREQGTQQHQGGAAAAPPGGGGQQPGAGG
ncbi:MAG: hypothetical protein QOG63_1642 [Thermoleophilaceae bacterium]|nr:hypothetical protein [Thermoleophilaceae bacterium]